MTLNGREFVLADCMITEVDDECIAYSEEMNKLMVLNSTAVLIWESLNNCIQNTKEVTTSSIVDKIVEYYSVTEDEISYVIEDVETIIMQLETEGFLSYL